MKVFTKTDFGIINFGRFKGKNWSDVPKEYLEYLLKDECLTSEFNKNIASQEIKQRGVLEGQIEMF